VSNAVGATSTCYSRPFSTVLILFPTCTPKRVQVTTQLRLSLISLASTLLCFRGFDHSTSLPLHGPHFLCCWLIRGTPAHLMSPRWIYMYTPHTSGSYFTRIVRSSCFPLSIPRYGRRSKSGPLGLCFFHSQPLLHIIANHMSEKFAKCRGDLKTETGVRQHGPGLLELCSQNYQTSRNPLNPHARCTENEPKNLMLFQPNNPQIFPSSRPPPFVFFPRRPLPVPPCRQDPSKHHQNIGL
jgi:hypothetical protein